MFSELTERNFSPSGQCYLVPDKKCNHYELSTVFFCEWFNLDILTVLIFNKGDVSFYDTMFYQLLNDTDFIFNNYLNCLNNYLYVKLFYLGLRSDNSEYNGNDMLLLISIIHQQSYRLYMNIRKWITFQNDYTHFHMNLFLFNFNYCKVKIKQF